MRAKHAREIRRGLHYGRNWANHMFECHTLKGFLMECLDDWSLRASDTANRAAARAMQKERISRGSKP